MSHFLSKVTTNGFEFYLTFIKLFICAFSWNLTFDFTGATATTQPETVPQQAIIKQLLNTQIDLSLRFTDQEGVLRSLEELQLRDRPTIIAPVYYECPRLCTLTLNGLVASMNELDLELGKDYQVLSISFNPAENHRLAKKKAENYYKELKSNESLETAWRFLTGTSDNVSRVMTQLGFEYVPDGQEFSHAAAIMILTPGGRISRYFIGVEFPPTELKFSLIEASEGKIGSFVDHAFLYCFRFDPTKGRYTPVIWNITRLICIATAIALAALLCVLWFRKPVREADS